MIGSPITEAYLSKTHLLSRGWTHPLIKKLLGEPDKTVPNKRPWKADNPVYSAQRVREAENSPVFKVRLQRKFNEWKKCFVDGKLTFEKWTVEK
jgi:hypothetical protein